MGKMTLNGFIKNTEDLKNDHLESNFRKTEFIFSSLFKFFFKLIIVIFKK